MEGEVSGQRAAEAAKAEQAQREEEERRLEAEEKARCAGW